MLVQVCSLSHLPQIFHSLTCSYVASELYVIPDEIYNTSRPHNVPASVVKHRKLDPQVFNASPEGVVDIWVKNYESVN